LWYDDSKLNALLYCKQGKVTKRERKKIVDTGWEN